MKTIGKALTLVTAMLASTLLPANADVLLGTTGSGNQLSWLVEIDQLTGALIRTIGPVGYKVNGLAWDRTTKTLYATTSVKDNTFHGLITINYLTGEGTPVDAHVVNYGLGVHDDGSESPILGITMDSRGQMVGWYQEFDGGSDTFVTIDRFTGTAVEFPDTGIEAARIGLAFDRNDVLWLIDSPAGPDIQLAYILDPATGQPLFADLLSPPTPAALGDFGPGKNVYFGINKDPLGEDPSRADLVKVNTKTGRVTTVGRTVDNLHVIVFVKPPVQR